MRKFCSPVAQTTQHSPGVAIQWFHTLAASDLVLCGSTMLITNYLSPFRHTQLMEQFLHNRGLLLMQLHQRLNSTRIWVHNGPLEVLFLNALN
jgi:hypothetical protein